LSNFVANLDVRDKIVNLRAPNVGMLVTHEEIVDIRKTIKLNFTHI